MDVLAYAAILIFVVLAAINSHYDKKPFLPAVMLFLVNLVVLWGIWLLLASWLGPNNIPGGIVGGAYAAAVVYYFHSRDKNKDDKDE